MYEDLNVDALKEAGLRGSRIREGDDGFGWIDSLREVAAEEKSRRSNWGGRYEALRLPQRRGAGKSVASMPPDRIGLLKEAQAKVDLRRAGARPDVGAIHESPVHSRVSVGAIHELPLHESPAHEPPTGCSAGCGSDQTGWKGMCQACYDKGRPDRWRGGKYHKVSWKNHEPVFRMVQAMAAQEKRSVSEMIMVLVADAVVRRMQEQADAPPKRRYSRKAGRVVQ